MDKLGLPESMPGHYFHSYENKTDRADPVNLEQIVEGTFEILTSD